MNAAAPAITDADLASLIGFASTTPPPPADLADRIMARAAAAMANTALPAPPARPIPPLRGARPQHLQRHLHRRWLRLAIGTGASLLIGTAVAAGLAQTSAFAPLLEPLLARVAALTGRPPLAAPTARPAPPVPPPVPLTVPALPREPSPTVRIDTMLPAPPQTMALTAEPPRIIAGLPARAAGTAAAQPDLRPDIITPRPNVGRPLAIARAAAEGTDTPARDAAVLPAPLLRPESPALSLPQRPEAPGRAAEIASGIAPPSQLAELATPADVPVPVPVPINPAARARLEAALPATASERAAAIAYLRAARQAGTITPDQAQRLRTLQQLRNARSTRQPRATPQRPQP